MTPLRLDLVSPLPPMRTGIADYARDLLPALAARCDLRVVRLPGQEVAAELEARWAPIGIERVGESRRVPLYQMGNNAYHREVYAKALEVPGIVVLHDLVLHHFHLGRFLSEGRDDVAGVAVQLAADHGWIGEVVAAPLRWGAFGDAAQFSLAANRTLALAARGVLVHGEWARDRLAEEVPEARVRVVPMPVPLPPAPDPAACRAFRESHGIPADALLLGSFGFQSPIKRTAAAIRALARPELAGVRLLVVGAEAETVDLESVAWTVGVADRVTRLGYLPYDEMEAAIGAVDLAVNLRYPTAGETSASLLRVLALGRTALVSDHGGFSDLPDEVVVKVPLGDGEGEAIAAQVGRLAADRDLLARMAAAARAHVAREHDPSRAADGFVDACRELAVADPPGGGTARPAPPTSTTWHHLPGRIEVDGVDGWGAGERRTLAVTLRNEGLAVWRAGEEPEGGVVLEMLRVDPDGGETTIGAWQPLPRDLGPGEQHTFRVSLRRPRHRTWLRFEPRVIGGGRFRDLDGPVWHRDLGVAGDG